MTTMIWRLRYFLKNVEYSLHIEQKSTNMFEDTTEQQHNDLQARSLRV